MRKVTSIPNASRTFEALRSLGYDLNSSIADLLDNSITPTVGATEVRIHLVRERDHFKIRIQDDGCGMNASILEEAMRIGAESTYKKGDLGKFGMGMKTASLSHCHVLTIISKCTSGTFGFRWDLNHVRETDDGWVLFELSALEIKEILEIEKLSIHKTGTIVFWDDLFLLDEEYGTFKNEKLATNYIFQLEERLRLHLRMVFHRFIKENKIQIFVNDRVKLLPWDPFYRNEKNTHEIKLSEDLSQFRIKGYPKPVLIRAFVLPNREAFSSEEAWKEAKGLLSWNDSQGYYIYRSNRIIRFGGWQGTRSKDEHDKLARVSIDIDPSLDRFFRINVNKATVQFPESLFNHLKNNINPVVSRYAQREYRSAAKNEKFENRFRRQEQKLNGISRSLVNKSGVKTSTKLGGTNVYVSNQSGTWLANKVSEFLKYGSNKDFEVVSGEVPDGHLWRVICNTNEKIKVIVNNKHPFYGKIYGSSSNKNITNAIDALIFSLAFAELFNKSDQNAQLFDTFKTVCAQALSRLTKEEII